MGAGTITARPERADRARTAGTVGFFVLLTALAAAAFWPSITTGFFIDDFGYLAVALPDGWWHSGRIWDFASQTLRPVTAISIGLQQELFGFRPLPFHLLALGLVVLQGVLVHRLAGRLGLGEAGRRVAAAVLVLHTTNGWALMWTASTSSLYVVVFSLGVAILLAGETVGRGQLAGATALLVLALLSREVAVVLPLAILLVRYWRGAGRWWPRLLRSLRETWPLLATSALFSVARLVAAAHARSQPSSPRLVPLFTPPAPSEVLSELPIRARDLLVLASGPFRAFLDTEGFRFPWWVLAVAVAFWAVVVALVVREARAGRWVAALGLGWFVVCLLPPLYAPGITYGNYADLAIPGLALALGAVAQSVVAGWTARARIVAGAFGLVLLTWLAYHGGNTLIRPAPPFIVRAEELIAWAREAYPDPAPGSTILVPDPRPEDPLWTSNGDLFRVMYDDPTLQVGAAPPPGG